MASTMTTDTTEICETILRKEKQYNEDKGIWPSQNRVVDRLLARQPEMVRAYREVHDKLAAHPHALSEFWRVLMSTAALWNPERNAEARASRDRLIEVNREIADKAAELAHLLEERSDLRNTSGFHDDTLYSVIGIIEAATEGNHLHRMYLRKPLKALSAQFDLKYWPTPEEFMAALASDADAACPEASDPLTEAATRASRPSKADFFKALFVAIDENRTVEHGWLPNDFKLTDETLASLANCALDLGPDDGVDGAYVKRLRQRERASPSAGDDLAT